MFCDRVLSYIRKYTMIVPGDIVAVGLSGGADSVCLLLMLHELSGKLNCTVRAFHVNHNLRDRESDEDQRFTETLCRNLGIPLDCFSVQVKELALQLQVGIEEAGREARRRVCKTCMEERGVSKIALAHHRDDQSETVLFRMARGTSLAGLSGIRPVSGAVIHPLLFAGKGEILAELERRGQDWRTDSSNLTDHYTRNVIRHQILPLLEKRVNTESVCHIAETAEDAAEADQFLRELSQQKSSRYFSADQMGGGMLLDEILREKPILQRYMILDILERIVGRRKDLGREQIRQIQDLLSNRTGRRYRLPGNVEAVRDYTGVMFIKEKNGPVLSGTQNSAAASPGNRTDEERQAAEAVRITGPGTYRCGEQIITCTLTAPGTEKITEKRFTKWLDYDKIKSSLEIRTRKPGDYLVVNSSGGKKKLKDYLIDQKVPAGRRDQILLLASGSRVFWVIGYRISEDCKITDRTEHIIRMEVQGGFYE